MANSRTQKLRSRFLIAGSLIVASTIASGVFSILTFASLSRKMNDTLLKSQEAIDLASSLSSSLEREDDTLLLGIKDDQEDIKPQLSRQRNSFDQSFSRLLLILDNKQEREIADMLRAQVDSYRRAGDSFLETAREPDAHKRYHFLVNPLLRKAVADCSRIQEQNFASMKEAGLQAQEVARSSTLVVILVSVAALVVSIVVSFQVAQSVEKPIRDLTEGVEAIRAGDFDRRLKPGSTDELARLAEGFNRMAETLALFRHTNLGEVLRAKKALEATIAALPDAVIVVRSDGTFELSNERARSVLAAMGNPEASSIDQIHLPEAGVQAIQRAIHGEQRTIRWELEEAIPVLIHGRLRKLLPNALPIQELSEGQRGAILVLYDVTDYARLDELRTELVAAASHELKTPLTALRMNLLLLRENAGNLRARDQEIIAGAIAGCEDLARTVDELLDLTRIEAQQLRLHFQRVDLNQLVSDVVNAARVRFDDSGIALNVEAMPASSVVRADPSRLRVVLSNLLDNALKYTPTGGNVVVQISPADGGFLQIAVTDSGVGIAPEFRERVFERFFRVEHELTIDPGVVKGAGIGLYLCKQIVQAHGGTIHCESAPNGTGALFVMQLPAVAEVFV